MRLPTRLLALAAPALAALVAALLVAPALLAASASAQTVLQPGHPDLMTDGLSLDSQVMAVRIAEPAVQDIGTMVYEVERSGDRVTLTTTSNVPMMNQTGAVTAVFEWPSLRPVSRERTVEEGADRVAYDGARVTGEYGRGEFDPLPFDITLQTTPFAPETLPVLARALPFRAGYVATVPTFSANRRLRDVTLTVIGEESFSRGDGSAADTWVVEETSEGRGSRTQRYYVDAATRELVAVSFEPQEGTTVVTEPTTEEALAEVAANRSRGVALRPGSEALATDALQSYSQDYVIKVVQPVQQDAGTQSRTVTVDRDAGTVTIQGNTEIAMAGQDVVRDGRRGVPVAPAHLEHVRQQRRRHGPGLQRDRRLSARGPRPTPRAPTTSWRSRSRCSTRRSCSRWSGCCRSRTATRRRSRRSRRTARRRSR